MSGAGGASATGGPRRLRVLHVITRLIVGGAQENTIASVARVDPARFDSRLWIGPQTGTEGSLVDDARARGIEPVVFDDLVRQVAPVRDLRVIGALARRLRAERFDVIHTHSSKAGIVGRIAARRARVPVVVHTAHGWGFHDHMAAPVRALYVGLERWMEPWTDALVSVSEKTTRIGLAAGIGTPERYRMIRSGIPLDRFGPDAARRAATRAALGLPDDAVVIGSVGRLSPQKNPADFVAVAARLAPTRPGLRFVYVGDGPLRADVQAAAAAAGVADRIVWTGVRDDVPDLLRAMDVFVLTSLWEGLPRVIPQALATGVPVLAYGVSGIDEILKDGRNGWTIRTGDVDAMAARAASLVDDAGARTRVGRAAVEEFDPAFSEDAMIRALEELYAELAARKGIGGGA